MTRHSSNHCRGGSVTLTFNAKRAEERRLTSSLVNEFWDVATAVAVNVFVNDVYSVSFGGEFEEFLLEFRGCRDLRSLGKTRKSVPVLSYNTTLLTLRTMG